MRCLVTGAAGFIGSHLCDYLLELGHEVRGVDSLARGDLRHVNPGVEFHKADIRSPFTATVLGTWGTDWVFHGMMRFPGDVLAQFYCGTALPEADELEVIGSEGSLFLDDPYHCVNPVIEVRRGDAVDRIEFAREDSYRLELENVSDAIHGEAPLLLARDDAIAQARALEALHSSAESGGTTLVP